MTQWVQQLVSFKIISWIENLISYYTLLLLIGYHGCRYQMHHIHGYSSMFHHRGMATKL